MASAKEKSMRRKFDGMLLCSALALAVAAVGCGNRERDATESAIDAAQGAVHAVEADAQKYVPEQLQAAENALQSARSALAKRDYDRALTEARDATDKAKEMALTAVGKKQEWEKTWQELNESIPRTMEQVKHRLDLYSSKGVRVPEGVDSDVLDQGKAEYAKWKETWDQAASAATKGDLRDAIEKGTSVRDALAKWKDTLGIKDKS
jgi:hypothetical protein